ncbi:pseudouridine synthase [Candidatus Tisiphia endosymbiont of Hybos culiciformis]|uniref:pseudouridine synthase n=1 Tax=Candidatus Tisiphia endosymbiont of Hybos culiciformis TaxID=3139331 RepID=UPI003CCAC612
MTQDSTQRLAKAISNAGICSRRDAEVLIKNGEVKVNGMIIDSPATLVDNISLIEVSGKVINQQQTPRLWAYYKPIGLITSHKDNYGRETVFENLALQNMPRVISIGRLDINSEGLLLLTNNGDLARKFELPSSKLERIYKVRAHGNPNLLLKNYKNIEIDQIRYDPKSIKLTKSGKTNCWFEVILTEGKNREIRKIFEYFGLSVNRLIRISYGGFLLGDLQPNQYKELPLEKFKKFL